MVCGRKARSPPVLLGPGSARLCALLFLRASGPIQGAVKRGELRVLPSQWGWSEWGLGAATEKVTHALEPGDEDPRNEQEGRC